MTALTIGRSGNYRCRSSRRWSKWRPGYRRSSHRSRPPERTGRLSARAKCPGTGRSPDRCWSGLTDPGDWCTTRHLRDRRSSSAAGQCTPFTQIASHLSPRRDKKGGPNKTHCSGRTGNDRSPVRRERATGPRRPMRGSRTRAPRERRALLTDLTRGGGRRKGSRGEL